MKLPISFQATLISLLFFSLTYHGLGSTRELFLQCLMQYSTPSGVVHAPNTTSYSSILVNPAENQRVKRLPSNPKPLLIISPTHDSHVQATVACARAHRYHLRVRSGGHDYEGLSYVSRSTPFVMLDLQNLRSISVDPISGVAWVEAGATLGELYYTIYMKNISLAFPAGICSTVGVGGQFSAGGLGTMARAHGLAVDHIVDARIVNVEGEILDRKLMGEDLFWAIRGGGGASFGVILSYKITLVNVPPRVTVFTMTRTLGQGATMLISKWQEVAYKVDDRLFIRTILQAVGEDGNKTMEVAFNSLFLGEKDELLEVMEGCFPELGLVEDACQEMSWIHSTLYFDGSYGDPLTSLLNRTKLYSGSYKAKSDFVKKPISEVEWEKIWGWILGRDERPIIVIDPLGGKMDEVSECDTPFIHRRGSLYNIQYLLKWGDQEGSVLVKKHLDWIRDFYKFMTPYVSKNPRSAYLNYRDLDLGMSKDGYISYPKARVWGRRYFGANFRRLAQVKASADPENFFWHEQSIPPLH